jgi:hypothetical protein
MVERPDALHRPEREPLRERSVARVEAGGGTAKDPVGVGVVLEDSEDDLVRSPA